MKEAQLTRLISLHRDRWDIENTIKFLVNNIKEQQKELEQRRDELANIYIEMQKLGLEVEATVE